MVKAVNPSLGPKFDSCTPQIRFLDITLSTKKRPRWKFHCSLNFKKKRKNHSIGISIQNYNHHGDNILRHSFPFKFRGYNHLNTPNEPEYYTTSSKDFYFTQLHHINLDWIIQRQTNCSQTIKKHNNKKTKTHHKNN